MIRNHLPYTHYVILSSLDVNLAQFSLSNIHTELSQLANRLACCVSVGLVYYTCKRPINYPVFVHTKSLQYIDKLPCFILSLKFPHSN